MWYRLLLGLGLIAVAVLATLSTFANPVAPLANWSKYRAALAAGDYAAAAETVSAEVLAADERHRNLALGATENELIALPGDSLASVLGIHEAVFEGRLPVDALRAPSSPRALHAALRRALTNKPFLEIALLLALPTGTDRAIGWVGPAAHADSTLTLALSVAWGMRMEFVREAGIWRLNYLPLIRTSARANESLIGTGSRGAPFEQRKAFFNAVLAHDDPAKQAALWTPIETRLPRRKAALQ